MTNACTPFVSFYVALFDLPRRLRKKKERHCGTCSLKQPLDTRVVVNHFIKDKRKFES